MKRPDYTDLAQARDRAARHKRCVCGDKDPCTCGRLRAPSPGFRFGRLRLLTWNDFLLVIEVAVEAIRGVITPKLDLILKEMRIMGAQTEAGLAHLKEDLAKVRDGWAALIAERDQFKAALESADADKAAAVQSALDADDAVDSAAIAEADALVHDLVNRAEEPPAGGGEQPPAEPAPAEEPPAQPEPTSADGA